MLLNLASPSIAETCAALYKKASTVMPRFTAKTAKIEAKQVLDELWSEKLIPFALRVGKIEETPDEYTIYFHDSRMHSVCIPIIEGHSFRDSVRSAVLARVSEISGPFKKPPLT